MIETLIGLQRPQLVCQLLLPVLIFPYRIVELPILLLQPLVGPPEPCHLLVSPILLLPQLINNLPHPHQQLIVTVLALRQFQLLRGFERRPQIQITK